MTCFIGCTSPAEKQARQEFQNAKHPPEPGLRSTQPPDASETSTPSATGNEKRQLPTLTADSTLADYLAYAALNNAGLEASFNRWKAALERLPQARTLPDPKFNYGYFIREVETRVGPQQHRLGIAQMFPWFGKLRLQGEVALAEADAHQQQYEAQKLKLFYQVKDAYYEYYYLGRAIDIARDNIQLLKHLEQIAQTRFKAGAPMTGVTRAQLELSKLGDRLDALTALRAPIAARFNAALNRPSTTTLPMPERFALAPANFSDNQLLHTLQTANPELKELTAVAAREEKAIALAKRAYYPDFTLGLDYIQTGDALSSQTPDNSKDPVIAMFSINLPIWWEKYRAAVAEAHARRTSALQLRENRANLLQSDLQMTLYRFHDAERKIDLYRDSLLPQGRGALEVAQQAYEAGKVDFSELIDAQRLLLEFQLEHERAIANREQRLAEIEMLVGKSLAAQDQHSLSPATRQSTPQPSP